MQINQFVFNAFSENTWLIWDNTLECVFIDPGCSDRGEQDEIRQFVNEKGLRPRIVLNTHCHLDHVFGNDFLTREYKIPLFCPDGEQSNLRHAEASAKLFGIHGFVPSPEPNEWIRAGGEIRFGESFLEVLFTPGHTAGHVSFFSRTDKALFCGDVLFDGSIGRTDFPGGSYPVLMNSIFKVLLPLGDEVRVHSGHGPITTLGKEKSTNPFLIANVQG